MRKSILAILALLCPAAVAHEFWIESSRFHPAVGERIELKLKVGEKFEGEPVMRRDERIRSFGVWTPGAKEAAPISGADGADPAGTMSIQQAGLHVVGYHNTPSYIEVEPAKFSEYLKEDGLEHIIAERAQLGESNKPGREAYERCAKALVAAGEGAAHGHDRVLGFPLEIVPVGDPFSATDRGTISVRILFRQRPLAGLKVSAIQRGNPESVFSARSDSEGIVRLELKEPGVWMIYGVHMIRAEDDPKADWRSFWASLTFERSR